MGTIAVHEFITLDGVIDTPSWTFDYPFDPGRGHLTAEFGEEGAGLGEHGTVAAAGNSTTSLAGAWSSGRWRGSPGSTACTARGPWTSSLRVHRLAGQPGGAALV